MPKSGLVTGMTALAIALGAAGAAPADVFSSKNRKAIFSSQAKLLDNRASKQYSASVRLQPPKVEAPTNWAVTPKYNGSYKGKTVVLVGLGESSTDMASDVAKTAKHVHVIVRSPTLLLPRNTFGTNIAPDHKLTRALLHCPQYLRSLKLMSQTILFGPFDWVARQLGVESFGVDHDTASSFQDNWSWDWWLRKSTLVLYSCSTLHLTHFLCGFVRSQFSTS